TVKPSPGGPDAGGRCGVEHLAHAMQQVVALKRLVHDGGRARNDAAASELFVAVTRDEDGRARVSPRGELARELRPVHAGHDDVDDESVEAAARDPGEPPRGAVS